MEIIKKDTKVELISKLPDCIPQKGCGVVISTTQVGAVVKWDDGGVGFVYMESLKIHN